jgi:hypothetical protein
VVSEHEHFSDPGQYMGQHSARVPMLGTRPCLIAARCSSLRLFCSAASIHLTTMGASMPSHTCLLSSVSIAAAASSLLPIVTRPQPLVVGAPCAPVRMTYIHPVFYEQQEPRTLCTAAPLHSFRGRLQAPGTVTGSARQQA